MGLSIIDLTPIAIETGQVTHAKPVMVSHFPANGAWSWVDGRAYFRFWSKDFPCIIRYEAGGRVCL